jgi:3-oxoadipate enol-lactonase
MHITVNGLKLFYEDAGEGTPLVLLHGFPLDHRMWSNQVSALKQSYRLITPDLQGMGQSEVPLTNRTLDQYADDVLSLLDQLHIEQAILGGFSMGGYIAFSLIRKAPARFSALILANTRPEADTKEGRKNRMNMAASLFEKGAAAARDAMLPKLLTEQTLQERKELAHEVSEAMLSMDPEGLVHATLAMAFRQDSVGLLPAIQVPTLVIAGEKDAIAPPEAMKKMADQIPGSRYHVIAGASHLAPMEYPEAFNQLLSDFLP